MRYLTILLAFMIAAGTVAAFTAPQPAETEAAAAASFKILNDTGADIQIHTGSGFVELNKGASTSITCEAGREIRQANKGKKGDVIFTVEDSMCGKTVKLSAYL